MTKETDLIAKQQLEIQELKEYVEELEDQKQQVYYSLYNIGAPLNDNCLMFNHRQLKFLQGIARVLVLDV